jgi:hypothetical protein
MSNKEKKKSNQGKKDGVIGETLVSLKRKYTKHTNDEERKKAILESKRKYAKERYAKQKALKQGGGILDSIKSAAKSVKKSVENTAKSVKNTVVSTANSAEKYVNAVVNGRNDYPPKVRSILEQQGDQVIVGITIGRTPVPSVLTSILSIASGGVFGANLKNSPYDTLFHLFLRLELDNGTVVSLEKNEVINMDINPPLPANTQTQVVTQYSEGLTPNGILGNAQKYMGGKFFTYSARDNNCQNFILDIFISNNIGTAEDKSFIKQDTKQLFGDMVGLRKLSNTVTGIGATVNTITTGAGLKENSVNFDKIKWGTLTTQFKAFQKKHPSITTLDGFSNYILTHPKEFREKTLQRAHFYINVVRKGKGIENKISTNIKMPKFPKGSQEAKDYMASLRAKKGKGIAQTGTVAINLKNKRAITGTGASADTDNSDSDDDNDSGGGGLYASGGKGLYSSGADTGGQGVHIHHHYHFNSKGGSLKSIGNDIKNAFSKKNITHNLDVAGHYLIPSITGALGGAAGSLVGGPAGGVLGSSLGGYAGNQIDKALGIQNATNINTGAGIKKRKQKK